ncbi:hypothetical protein Emed_005197 [Eimeria media]
MSSADEAKKHAATEAVDACIRSGMRVGLGTGSTASFAVRRLAERLKAGELSDITCAATSEETRRLHVEERHRQHHERKAPLVTQLLQLQQHGSTCPASLCPCVFLALPICSAFAESLGVSVQPLDSLPLPLDIAIDGADEILLRDNQLVLIKGRGGALLREKLVETYSKQFVCSTAAAAAAVAAVSPGNAAAAEEAAASLGISAQFRKVSGDRDDLFVSDNGNYCLDLFFKHPIPDPQRLHDCLIKVSSNPILYTQALTNSTSSSNGGRLDIWRRVVGVVETGIFVGLTRLAIIGHSSEQCKCGTSAKVVFAPCCCSRANGCWQLQQRHACAWLYGLNKPGSQRQYDVLLLLLLLLLLGGQETATGLFRENVRELVVVDTLRFVPELVVLHYAVFLNAAAAAAHHHHQQQQLK